MGQTKLTITPIGRLRWPVRLYLRQQLPDTASSGIIETPTEIQRLHADIQPMRAMTFYAGANANGPDAPTHTIETRWNDQVDTRHAFVRRTTRPDGTPRDEVFRVRRSLGDVDGRKVRSRYECQLETSDA